MIKKNTHSTEWISKKKKEFKDKDPQLIEKVIKALTLLESLQNEGLVFTFKGGTSLILIIQEAHRFSIDVDLLVPIKPKNLDEIFDRVIKNGIFTEYKEDVRSSSAEVPKSHYKFYFDPIHPTGLNNSYILLDLLYEAVSYSETKKVAIECTFIDYETPEVIVTVPTIDAILGDKLTAFAPNTTGIRYGVNKELEIAKQLFDVAKLFDVCQDPQVIHKNLENISKKEIAYRSLKGVTHNDVLDDCFQTAVIIGQQGKIEQKKYEELIRGIKALGNFVYSGPFNMITALECAAKVAYLSRVLRHKPKSQLEHFNNNSDLSKLTFPTGEFEVLGKLKKQSPTAFYYFHKAVSLHNNAV